MQNFKSTEFLQTRDSENFNTFLVFNLENEEYAVDILKVQEIQRYENVLRTHNLPFYIKGFMQVDNNIIPILDLRILYGLKEIQYTEFAVVIVLRFAEQFLGIVVNSAPEIVYMENSQIKPLSGFCVKIPKIHIKNIGILEKRFIVILDLEKLFSTYDFESLEKNWLDSVRQRSNKQNG